MAARTAQATTMQNCFIIVVENMFYAAGDGMRRKTALILYLHEQPHDQDLTCSDGISMSEFSENRGAWAHIVFFFLGLEVIDDKVIKLIRKGKRWSGDFWELIKTHRKSSGGTPFCVLIVLPKSW